MKRGKRLIFVTFLKFSLQKLKIRLVYNTLTNFKSNFQILIAIAKLIQIFFKSIHCSKKKAYFKDIFLKKIFIFLNFLFLMKNVRTGFFELYKF